MSKQEHLREKLISRMKSKMALDAFISAALAVATRYQSGGMENINEPDRRVLDVLVGTKKEAFYQ